MSKILKRPMFRRGGFADTGIMEGFSNGGDTVRRGTDTSPQELDSIMGLIDKASESAPAPTATEDTYTPMKAPDEPLFGLEDYFTGFKLGANIASAPGRGPGLGGFLAAAGPSLAQAADEFGARQEARAARKREFEATEQARKDAFEEARRGEKFQTGLLREEFDLKTTLEKLKIELDPPDAIVRLRQAEPLQAELANAKTKREQIFADANTTPKEKRDILLEIRNLQNQIAGVMGQAVDVGELEREDRRRINNFAEDEALALLELDEIPESGEELREYNQLVEEIRQYKIVEELIILTQGATFAEGGRVGLANGGGPFEPGSGPDPDPGSPPIMRGDSPMLTFEELRARLPREVSDQVVRLIATSENALLDFANIDTQEDIAIFNQKYNVDLQLPAQVV